VVGGLIAHPFDAAGDVFRFWRDFTQAGVPDELTVVAAVVHSPDGSGMKLSVIAVCHAGSPQQAEKDIAPLREFREPLMVELGPMPYPVINTLLDANFPKGALNYWKSSFARSLDDGLLDAAVERFAFAVSPMSLILFEHFHGQSPEWGSPTRRCRTARRATTCSSRRCGWHPRRPSGTSPGRARRTTSSARTFPSGDG